MKIIKIFKWFGLFLFTYLLYTVIIVLCLKWIDPPTTAFIQSKTEYTLLISTSDYKNEWISLDKVSPNFPLAVIAAEDQRFFEHGGFDFVQIEKALDEMERGLRVRGASTITQQVAKNLFLWEWKSFFRKGMEAYYTILLELLWSKKRILEVYINTVELGNGVYGIESTCRLYLKKSSERITKTEAALAAAVLPNPAVRKLNTPTQYMIKRASRIVEQINKLGGEKFLKDNL